MFTKRPKNTSTPNLVPRVQGRHSYQDCNMPSPIGFMKYVGETGDEVSTQEISENVPSTDMENDEEDIVQAPNLMRKETENSDYSSDDTNSDSESDKLPQLDDKNTANCNKYKETNIKRFTIEKTPQTPTTDNMLNFKNMILVFIIGGVILSVVLGLKEIEEVKLTRVTINTLKELFPQDEKFWTFIKSGVMEINNFEKPTVIILMHKMDMNEIPELLGNITTYASCILNKNCSVEPIVLEGEDLNTNELIEDYGVLIDKYKLLLEEKRILVVKNIEKIPGSVAQAFHYFCDEYSPLVKKSLIIFTIQVNEFKGKEMAQAVNILNRKWKDIDPDKLEPLITRVSSIVLRIK